MAVFPFRRRALLSFAVAAVSAVTACGGALRTESAAQVSPVVDSQPARQQPCMVNGLSCDLRMRITTVDNYLRTRPGVVGYVVRDRVSGGSYANGNANAPIWTASTIKLATAADLLTRNRSGALHLSGGDYADIDRMLHTSDDDAADRLWFAYAGPDHLAFNNAFRGFGMTGLVPQAGFTRFYPYWGFQKCSAADLDRLMTHVLTGLHPDDRNYLVTRMRTVDANQQWGVWGAGPAQRPGLKDGWSEEQGGWVVNSVGFVGPGERYTLAIMNSLNGQGQFKDGAATDTQVAKLLFNGLS